MQPHLNYDEICTSFEVGVTCVPMCFVVPFFFVVGIFCGFERRSMLKNFGCDFFWPWVGGVTWGEGAREDCWCDYDRSV